MVDRACPVPDETRPIVIAGLGSVGRRHLQNLVNLGWGDQILLYRTGLSTLSNSDLAGFPVITNLEEALAQRPLAFVVANPTSLHLPTALAAVQAGSHLLLEKPISDRLDGLDGLVDAVAQQGVSVLVGFQFRYHPGLRQIKSWLGESAIGPVVSVQAFWGEYLPDWHPWEDYRRSYAARADLGGGVVRTLCHPFDYLRWLIGEVEAVQAMTGTLGGLGIEVEDTAIVTLRFSSGVIGNVYLDYITRPSAHRLEVIGQDGTIRWNAADGTAHLYRARTEERKLYSPPASFERNTLFAEEMRHFIACMAGEEQPQCTLNDGMRALEIALAACRSAAEARQIKI